MIARYFSTSTNAAATAAGVLLLALSAASLGCAFAAYSGGGEAAPKIVVTPAFAVPAVQAPGARPMAGVGEPSRCQGTPGARARRGQGLCRGVELPAV
jgi:hypothetical protein